MKRAAAPVPRGGGAPPLALWALLLALPAAGALKVHREVELDFFQESFPSRKEAGELMFEFDDEETVHVDWDQKQNVWRLPEMTRFMDFNVQGALGNLAVLKNNLGIMIKRSNRTQAEAAPPSATVYAEDPVELGDPNVLICFVDRFFPPVLNITWLKNGQVVSEGVQETAFYPSVDWTFRKFSYLAFVPEEGDFYTCQVDHWGLQESLSKIWTPKVSPPVSETMENILCGLGLTLGILGIIAGTILFFKARKRNNRAGTI
ncbi:RLA class II histocompatibility antigen, DP alpha-1 chain-like [Pogona vitticeps]